MTTTVKILTTGGLGEDVKVVNVSESAERVMLRNFNPTNNPDVDLIKVTCATVMSVLEDLARTKRIDIVCLNLARDSIETAQMHAVKSLFVDRGERG